MKDVVGFEGLYAITSCGKVWSYRRKKFLKPTKDARGYCRVDLRKNGTRKTCLVHRLVGEAYIDNPDGLPCINHKNENPSNNWISNLEWCSREYNNQYGNHSKNVRKEVYCIELDRTFESASAAAAFVNRSPSRVSECCQDKTQTCAGYHFLYR